MRAHAYGLLDFDIVTTPWLPTLISGWSSWAWARHHLLWRTLSLPPLSQRRFPEARPWVEFLHVGNLCVCERPSEEAFDCLNIFNECAWVRAPRLCQIESEVSATM